MIVSELARQGLRCKELEEQKIKRNRAYDELALEFKRVEFNLIFEIKLYLLKESGEMNGKMENLENEIKELNLKNEKLKLSIKEKEEDCSKLKSELKENKDKNEVCIKEYLIEQGNKEKEYKTNIEKLNTEIKENEIKVIKYFYVVKINLTNY